MKRINTYPMQLALGACLALPVTAPALADDAQQPDTSGWTCKFCVVSDGWFGDLEFGAIYVDDWSPKFGDYRGFDDDGMFLDAGGFAGYRNANGYYIDIAARDLGLESRALDARGVEASRAASNGSSATVKSSAISATGRARPTPASVRTA